ncbi:hypothetical protein [Roseovarius salinarum]|uniref:hypothetical protein n=1 Tax=Roseovarius salinarum TaxID=1981892 RepID=UPI000C32D40B|nr:hypothetical protein [Roseovarius salinarum]
MTDRLQQTLNLPLVPGGAQRRRRLAEKLGPAPAATLRAMTDYGLTDREIARYFGLTPSTAARLRRALVDRRHG